MQIKQILNKANTKANGTNRTIGTNLHNINKTNSTNFPRGKQRKPHNTNLTNTNKHKPHQKSKANAK